MVSLRVQNKYISRRNWKSGSVLLLINCLHFLLFCGHHAVIAQGISLQWAKSMGGTQNDWTYGIAVDQNGNVYTAGTFTGTADFDPGSSSALFTSNGAGDIFINKLDANGNFVWNRTMGGTGTDIARSVVLDANGNIYTTGTFSGTVDFDPGPGVFNMTSAGSYDCFIHKLDPSGNLVWAKQIGSTGNDVANSIILDASANVYTTGGFSLTVDFDPGPGTYTLNSGGRDFFISKLDVNGNFVLASNICGAPNSAEPQHIQLDPSGNIYIAGVFSGLVDFNPGPGTFTLNTAGTFLDYDIFIAKYDPAVNFTYVKAFGNTVYDDVRRMVVDASGNVYTTGYVELITDFDPGPGTYTTPIYGMQDIFVHKLDAAGNFAWARRMGFTGGDFGNGLCLDAAGNVYTTGQFYSTVDFDPGPGTYTLGAGAAGNVFIHKLDPSGNFIFARQLPGPGNDWGQAMVADAAGNIYLTGAYTSSVDLDPGPGTQISTSAGSSDIFVEKFNACSFPVAGSIYGPTTVCSAAATMYSVAPVAGAYTYAWALPGGWSGNSSTNTISVQTGTTSGNISVSVTDGCGTSAFSNLSVTVNVSPVITVNSGTLCQGQSFTLAPSGASSYTYQGGSAIVTPTISSTFTVSGTSPEGCTSAANATSSITVYMLPTVSVNSGSICIGKSFTISPGGASTYTFSGGSAVVSPSATTSYSVTGTSTAGCVSPSPAVSNVVVNAQPTIAVSGNSIICKGSVATETATGAATYTWNTSQVSPTVSLSPASTSVYTVTGMDNNSCVNSTTFNVFVNPLPTITVAGSNSVCFGSAVTQTASGAITYSWSAGINTSTISLSPNSTTSYTVYGTDANNCTGQNTINISVVGLPMIIVSSPVNVCYGSSITQTATGANSYTWSTGETTNTMTIAPSTTSIFTVTGTGPGGCINSATSIVNVMPLPLITVTGASVVCAGSSAYLAAAGANSYTWSTGENTPSLSPSPLANNTYTVWGTDNNNCVNTSTFYVTVTALPVTDFSYSTACNNSTNQVPVFDTQFVGGGNFNSINLQVNTQTGEFDPGAVNAGSYIVTYSVTANGCTGTHSSIAQILPVAGLNLPSSMNITPGSSVTLHAEGGTTYTWFPPGGLSCTQCPEPIATPQQNTSYCAESIVNSCLSRACVNIILGCDGTTDFSTPNAFTPNGDGNNDLFCLRGWNNCVEKFNVKIFNRWGENVYESSNPDFCWDGMFNGQLLDAETYVCVLTAIKFDKSAINKRTTIALIR